VVLTPAGSESITIINAPSVHAYNYNCQKWKIADLTWEDGVFKVDQQHLGPLALPNACVMNTPALDSAGYTPPWIAEPYYMDEKDLWIGAWSGYTKNTADATVTL